MGILNGMKDLGLIHMTADGMANSGVAKGAQRVVEEEGVVVKGQEVIKFRQLQNVNTPTMSTHHQEGRTRLMSVLLLAQEQIKTLIDNLAQ